MKNQKSKIKNQKYGKYFEKGLTLLELVVVIAMIGVLVIAAFGFLNPFAQLQKADDGQRKNDLAQIKTVLDTYYNDMSCYPTSVPFGQMWSVNNTTYMPKVPQGNDCATNPESCYIYIAESTCSQWNVVFTKLSSELETGSVCELDAACLPQNSSANWACTVSGEVDCVTITSFVLPSGQDSGTNSPQSPTPLTPTQSCPQGERNYACAGAPSRCNSVPSGSGTYCASNCDGAC